MIKRVIEQRLQDLMVVFLGVAVIGCCQLGKTTLVRLSEILQGHRYITLDGLSAREVAHSNPRGLLESNESVIINEVQLAPQFLRDGMQQVDEDRRPGCFILTVSAELGGGGGFSAILAGQGGVLLRPQITVFESCIRRGDHFGFAGV